MGVPRVGIVFGKGWMDGLVLPEPRKPVMIVIGIMLATAVRSCRSE